MPSLKNWSSFFFVQTLDEPSLRIPLTDDGFLVIVSSNMT